jgi:hypothetical protein
MADAYRLFIQAREQEPWSNTVYSLFYLTIFYAQAGPQTKAGGWELSSKSCQ